MIVEKNQHLGMINMKKKIDYFIETKVPSHNNYTTTKNKHLPSADHKNNSLQFT